MSKIKFNNARKPETLKVDGEKHLTLSDRRLSVQIMNPVSYKLGWSIDRITLVGTIKTDRNPDGTIRDLQSIMQALIDTGKPGVEKKDNGWLLRDRQGEQVAFVQYLDFDNTRGRIDFNPNKLSDYLQTTLKDFIDHIFADVKFSRVDVACDIFNAPDEFVRQYSVNKSVSSRVYRGKNGAMQTTYWGSPSSDEQVRLYDKANERRKKSVMLAEGISTWWRFEAQLRGSTTQEWDSSVKELLSYFTSTHFIPLDIVSSEKVMLIGLMEHPELFGTLSKATKAKYRKLIERVVENDELTQAMLEQFELDTQALKIELDSWLGYLDVTENYNLDDED